MRIILILSVFILSSFSLQARHKHKHHMKGLASFYAKKFDGRKTASGEIFSNKKFTAASNCLAFDTYVKVTNEANGNIVYVRINDRMSADNKRLIDLSDCAAEKLDFKGKGTTRVKVQVVDEDEGKDAILGQNEERHHHSRRKEEL